MKIRLDAVGFCGVDDSVDLEELAPISAAHSWVEWGVLLRPDKAGTPRYASRETLGRLGDLQRRLDLRIAAHFCGEDCLQALRGDIDHVQKLRDLFGFRRVQLNPTSANAASGWDVDEAARGVRALCAGLPDLEFIFQLNDETSKLASALFHDEKQPAPSNLAALLDSSCGRGVAPSEAEGWPSPLKGVHCGYAGGMGPDTVAAQLSRVGKAASQCHGGSVWIDMESSLRTVDGDKDIFDLGKCRRVLEVVEGVDGVTFKKGKNATKSAVAEPELQPAHEGATEMKVTMKRGAGFYANSACSFLKGVDAKAAVGDKEAVDAKPAVEHLRISGLGEAVGVAVAAATRVEGEGLATITRIQTAYPSMEGSGRGCVQILIDLRKK